MKNFSSHFPLGKLCEVVKNLFINFNHKHDLHIFNYMKMLKTSHLLSVDMEAPVGFIIFTSAVTFIVEERRPPKPFSSILDLKFIGALMIYAKVHEVCKMYSNFQKLPNVTQP